MRVNGWTLLVHGTMRAQLAALAESAARARRANPRDFRGNANVKLFAAAMKLMLEVIPADPGRTDYRQGNTLGPQYRHWFRARFAGRFRLFFRYDTASRTIVYAWVNDERTLRQSGGRTDPYAVFRRMLATGHPPDTWSALIEDSTELSDPAP